MPQSMLGSVHCWERGRGRKMFRSEGALWSAMASAEHSAWCLGPWWRGLDGKRKKIPGLACSLCTPEERNSTWALPSKLCLFIPCWVPFLPCGQECSLKRKPHLALIAGLGVSVRDLMRPCTVTSKLGSGSLRARWGACLWLAGSGGLRFSHHPSWMLWPHVPHPGSRSLDRVPLA